MPDKKTTIEKIIALIPKMSVEDFLGLAILLDVKLLTDKWNKEDRKAIPREAEDLLSECITKLGDMDEKDQKFYLSVIKNGAEKN